MKPRIRVHFTEIFKEKTDLNWNAPKKIDIVVIE